MDIRSEWSGGQWVRVLGDELAYFQEGLPVGGSMAEGEEVLDEGQAVIHYYFPVEIEVRGAPEAIDPDRIVEIALQRLTQSLRSLRG